MLVREIYYLLKPLIPRRLQVSFRRTLTLTLTKRARYKHVWPINVKAGRPPDNWPGWPEQKQFALVLMHDVETGKGHDKCFGLIDLEKSLGFRSSFNFVPERYNVSRQLRRSLLMGGFEVGVHGLKHDGRLFSSKRIFQQRAVRINHYLKTWDALGFTSPSMHHNLDWMHDLKITHATSTFDSDPFEPQSDALDTIFPFWVQGSSHEKGYVELPYTIPQDFTLFILMKERNIDIWKKKLDWIAEKGGMALLNTHPDYMSFDRGKSSNETYPVDYYLEFLNYLKATYSNDYYHALPAQIARFWNKIKNV